MFEVFRSRLRGPDSDGEVRMKPPCRIEGSLGPLHRAAGLGSGVVAATARLRGGWVAADARGLGGWRYSSSLARSGGCGSSRLTAWHAVAVLGRRSVVVCSGWPRWSGRCCGQWSWLGCFVTVLSPSLGNFCFGCVHSTFLINIHLRFTFFPNR